MKLKIITLIAVGLVFFSSCTKEEVDPVLEIFVTTKASQNWEAADIYVSTVRFAIEFEDGNQGWGSLQKYLGADFDAELQQDQSMLIFNDRHFDIDKLLGLKLDISSLRLSNSDTGETKIELPYFEFGRLDEIASIENGKSYTIEFILDLDELVYEENGKYILDNNYEIEISEL